MINIVLNQKKNQNRKKRRQLLCRVQKKKQTNKQKIYIIGVALENKIGPQKSTCVDYDSKKSTFLKRVKNKKQFHKLQNMDIYCKNCKKHTGNTFPKKNWS